MVQSYPQNQILQHSRIQSAYNLSDLICVRIRHTAAAVAGQGVFKAPKQIIINHHAVMMGGFLHYKSVIDGAVA